MEALNKIKRFLFEEKEKEKIEKCFFCGYSGDTDKLGRLKSWKGMKFHKRCLRKFKKQQRKR